MDETELIAAERALGHVARFGETADDARLRQAWERRLAPLLGAVAPVDPPHDAAERALAAIEAADGAPAAEVVTLRRRAGRWRAVAGIAMAAAAALAIYVAAPATPTESARYVAVVTADDGSGAGLVIEFDTASGVATVIPAGAVPPDGSSYEMWTIPPGQTRPVSLGLLPQKAVARREFSAAPGQLFAISIEPPGGSPTGQPTKALYHGTVVRVD